MAAGGYRPGTGRPPKSPELATGKISEHEKELRKSSMPKFDRFPTMPEGMLEGEIKIWNEIMKEYYDFYEATGIMPINSLDTKSLRNYCMYSAMLESLREELKKNNKAIVRKTNETTSTTNEGKKRVSKTNNDRINPIFAEIIKVETRQSTLAMQLNLTPDSRNRMGLAIAKNREDTLGKFLEDIDD